MPKCYLDAVEQPVLTSKIIPGEKMGFALCDGCLKKSDAELVEMLAAKMGKA